MNKNNFWVYSLIIIFSTTTLFTFFDIIVNGLTKTTLLDEFDKSDPVLIKYKEFTKHFDYEKEISLIINKTNNQDLSFNDLEELNDHISSKLSLFRGISYYSKLEDIKVPRFDQTLQRVFTEQIYDKNLKKINKELWHKLRKLNSFSNYPLSKNKKSYLIKITLKQMPRSDIMLETKNIFKMIKEFNKNDKFHMSVIGVEPFRHSIYDEVFRGYLILLPIILVLIFIICFFIFKNLDSILLIFLTLGFSFGTTASLIYTIDRHFSPFSSFSLLFVFVIGTSDIIHLLADLRESKSIELSLKNIYRPCLITSLTTFIGLFALIFSSFNTLQNFGLYGSIGIFVCFIITFHILPTLLDSRFLMKFKKRILSTQLKQKNINIQFLEKLINKPKTILSFTSLLIFTLVLNTLNIRFEDDFYKKFKPDHPISTAIEKIQKDFGHIGSIDLLIDKSSLGEKSFKLFLKKVESIPQVMSIKSSQSLKDDLKVLIKETSISNKLYSYHSLINLPFSFASKLNPQKERIIIQLADLSVETVIEAKRKIEQIIIKNKLSESHIIEVSGFSLIRTHFVNTLKNSYLTSLQISLILIFIVFLIYFKDTKIATLAMLPNLVPVLSITAIMGYFNISADMNLPLICSVALGLCVDDTIHFLHQFKLNTSKGLPVSESITQALKKVSLALITTTVILSASLLIFSFGKIQLFSQLGILMTVCALVALFFDLIVLPILIKKTI